MDTFSFSIPQNIIFGWGMVEKLSEVAEEIGGNKAFIISGPHLKKIGMVDKCIEVLGENGITCDSFTETEEILYTRIPACTSERLCIMSANMATVSNMISLKTEKSQKRSNYSKRDSIA